MYQKDFILNEAERLARLIAKLLGLKSQAGNDDEAEHLYQHALVDEFGLTREEMLSSAPESFKQWLQYKSFNAVKLDALAQLIYHDCEPLAANTETLTQLKKVLVIFDMLEQQHHQQSFDNLSKRNIIQQYIQKYHA